MAPSVGTMCLAAGGPTLGSLITADAGDAYTWVGDTGPLSAGGAPVVGVMDH